LLAVTIEIRRHQLRDAVGHVGKRGRPKLHAGVGVAQTSVESRVESGIETGVEAGIERPGVNPAIV
jgi:hypothetical protein